MTTNGATIEILNRDYQGMAISVTKNANGKHEYNAHWLFSLDGDDVRYPVNVCALDSLREIEAWIDGYQQGASDNR